MKIVFLICAVAGLTLACTDTRPTSLDNSLLIGLYRNLGGGSLGDACDPASCEATPIMQQYYKISSDTDNACYAWKGNAGENSGKDGVCHPEDSSYAFQQWTTCDCTGSNTNVKHAYVNKCVVENPPTLCSKIIDYGACGATVTDSSSSVTTTTTDSTSTYSSAATAETADKTANNSFGEVATTEVVETAPAPAPVVATAVSDGTCKYGNPDTTSTVLTGVKMFKNNVLCSSSGGTVDCQSKLVSTQSGPDSTCPDSDDSLHFWPIDYGLNECHGWQATDPNGKLHDNAANNIRCSADGLSLLYDQYAGCLDCGLSCQNPKSKTFVLNVCHQGSPPTLFDKGRDFSCCNSDNAGSTATTTAATTTAATTTATGSITDTTDVAITDFAQLVGKKVCSEITYEDHEEDICNGAAAASSDDGYDWDPVMTESPGPLHSTPAVPQGKKTVKVGIWHTADCTGEAMYLTFSADLPTTQCQSWNRQAGALDWNVNSLRGLTCTDYGFSYTQWTNKDCSATGKKPEGTFKEEHTNKCMPGTPPGIYTKVVDNSGCDAPVVETAPAPAPAPATSDINQSPPPPVVAPTAAAVSCSDHAKNGHCTNPQYSEWMAANCADECSQGSTKSSSQPVASCPENGRSYQATVCNFNDGKLPHYERIEYTLQQVVSDTYEYHAIKYVKKYVLLADCQKNEKSLSEVQESITIKAAGCFSTTMMPVQLEYNSVKVVMGAGAEVLITSQNENCACGGEYTQDVYRQIDDIATTCAAGTCPKYLPAWANFWLEDDNSGALYWGAPVATQADLSTEYITSGQGSAKRMNVLKDTDAEKCSKWSSWCNGDNEWMNDNCSRTCTMVSVKGSCYKWKAFCGANKWVDEHCKSECSKFSTNY